MPSYLFDRSGSRYPIDEPRWRGDDGSPLMVGPLPGISAEQIDTGERSHWRYRAALPLPTERISLGEGCTPLVSSTVFGAEVLVKPEWFNPTGSFKDRGTSVMVSLLADQGIGAILEDSSGNGGASVAAYCAAAGIEARILAPATTSPAKLQQARAHGAEVQLVPGSRADTSREAIRQSQQRFYASHNWHPFFLQGVKLLAYELWEQLGFRAPDNVVIPAGAGSLVLGCDLGFTELLAAGQIDALPRLLVAQPSNCAPLVRAFERGDDAVGTGAEAPTWSLTIAEGTAIASPVRDREVLAAIRRSGGAMAAIGEEAIAGATRELASRGWYAEPTSAMAAAGLRMFRQRQVDGRPLIGPDQTTVLVLTGSGLKAAGAMAAVFG
ncbi:pyridoxal-phosphate dependent enzyme [Parafrigoribacterium mesophilum]|uniref:threonine synthase n=1 Tax=Parafrigoribacterium mesophilum TaxID=433646 RepID=UPI0031FD2086